MGAMSGEICLNPMHYTKRSQNHRFFYDQPVSISTAHWTNFKYKFSFYQYRECHLMVVMPWWADQTSNQMDLEHQDQFRMTHTWEIIPL